MACCVVCCEVFNLSSRKKVSCNFCDFEACTTCSTKYLLDSSQDPHCMNCRKAWNREAMETKFSKKFYIIDYKKHREDVMFERELSMMPETQIYVEMERANINYQLKIDTIRSEIAKAKHNLMYFYKHYYDENSPIEFVDRLTLEYVTKESEHLKSISNLEIDLRAAQSLRRHYIGDHHTAFNEKRVFIRACPAADCKGFLSTQWKCGICGVRVCHDCHEIKGDHANAEGECSNNPTAQQHVCDPGNVETAKLLAKDTKPCPKCAAMIFRISGCDHMWCTVCKTGFSWKTMQVTNGVHNPHHYEYLRLHGGTVPREQGDNPGGGGCADGNIPHVHGFNKHLRAIMGTNPERKDIVACVASISHIHRIHGHIAQIEIPRFSPGNDENANRDIRVKYMMNNITKDEFKATLQMREKASDKNRELTMVFQTYQTVTAENLNAIAQAKERDRIIELYNRQCELREYINGCMEAIARRYVGVAPLIHDNWTMTSTGIEKRRKAEEERRRKADAVIPT